MTYWFVAMKQFLPFYGEVTIEDIHYIFQEAVADNE